MFDEIWDVDSQLKNVKWWEMSDLVLKKLIRIHKKLIYFKVNWNDIIIN